MAAESSMHSISLADHGLDVTEIRHNAKIPCIAGHPTDVIFLTFDLTEKKRGGLLKHNFETYAAGAAAEIKAAAPKV